MWSEYLVFNKISPSPQLLGLVGLLGGGAVSVVGIINLKKDGIASFLFFFL